MFARRACRRVLLLARQQSSRVNFLQTRSGERDDAECGLLSADTATSVRNAKFEGENTGDDTFCNARQIFSFLRLVSAASIGFLIAMYLFRAIFPILPILLESPDSFDEAFGPHHWDRSVRPAILTLDPDYFMHNVVPVRCHSHNDYWRQTPLYAALASGCISVEADVWLTDNDEILVGHQRRDLSANITLNSMYLDPLMQLFGVEDRLLEQQINNTDTMRGVFPIDPEQTLVLLIDFKTSGPDLLAAVSSKLDVFRAANLLTYWNGTARVERPLTIVATGNAPFELLNNERYRDIFYDAPLTHLTHPNDPVEFDNSTSMYDYVYNPSNSWYASANLIAAVGALSRMNIAPLQVELITQYIADAEVRGLVPRYWNTPRWPRDFRDHVWQVLVEQKTGILSVDDLRAVRKGSWGDWKKA